MKTVDLPPMDPALPLQDALFRQARRAPARRALGDADTTLTYAEVVTEIACRAQALLSHGVQPGDRVILCAANSVAFVLTHFAILTAGAISVPVDAQTSSERLQFLVDDCDARVVCVDEKARLAATPIGARGRAVITCETLQHDSRAMSGELSPRTHDPDSLATLMYTTGSTGQPKAAMLTHRSLVNAINHIIEFIGCTETDAEGVVLPLSHSFGLGHVYCTLSTGGYVWVTDGLRPPAPFFNALSSGGVNAMPTTPSMLRLLLGPYRAAFLRNAKGLRRIVVNSEPLPPAQAMDLLEVLPSTDVIAYYGLTEASRSAFLRFRDEVPDRYGTVGRPAPRVEIAVFDEDGRQLEVDVEGEVGIRGPHLAVGYWKRPDEEASTFRSGWLRTGDLGVLDSAGYLTITGRLKDQINIGGIKISASEVERTLRTCVDVVDVAVVGFPDPLGMRGESIGAAVQRANDALDETALRAFCTANLEPNAQPSHFVFVSSLPRAETGKVLKGEVRTLIEKDIRGTNA